MLRFRQLSCTHLGVTVWKLTCWWSDSSNRLHPLQCYPLNIFRLIFRVVLETKGGVPHMLCKCSAILLSLDLSLFILCKFYTFAQCIFIISIHSYTSPTLLNSRHPVTLSTSCYLFFFFLITPPRVQLVLDVYVGPSTRARTSYHLPCPQRRGTLRANRSPSRVGPLNAASTHVEF